jgi:hypothetical protein
VDVEGFGAPCVAFDTGVKLLPVSVTLLASSLPGPALAALTVTRRLPTTIEQVGVPPPPERVGIDGTHPRG